MVVYTLEQRWEILRHYFENHGNVAECVRKLRTDFGRREAPSAPYVRYLVKKVKETGILIDKPKREKPKIVRTPENIAAVAESVREAPSTSIDRYRAMLNKFLFAKIEEEDIGNIWFQQDGATCHTAEATLDVLRPVFEDRIISRRADVVWPPRSCDLTPLDYYLWGAVKDKCYADKPETIDALKDNIREAIGEIQLHTIDNYLKIGPIV